MSDRERGEQYDRSAKRRVDEYWSDRVQALEPG
jgi:hypothetical protein